MDAIAWVGIQRLAIIGGAIFFGYLGYRLYLNGSDKGRISGSAELIFGKVMLAGAGPGLGFMFAALVILGIAIWTSKAEEKKTQTPNGPEVFESRGGVPIPPAPRD